MSPGYHSGCHTISRFRRPPSRTIAGWHIWPRSLAGTGIYSVPRSFTHDKTLASVRLLKTFAYLFLIVFVVCFLSVSFYRFYVNNVFGALVLFSVASKSFVMSFK